MPTNQNWWESYPLAKQKTDTVEKPSTNWWEAYPVAQQETQAAQTPIPQQQVQQPTPEIPEETRWLMESFGLPENLASQSAAQLKKEHAGKGDFKEWMYENYPTILPEYERENVKRSRAEREFARTMNQQLGENYPGVVTNVRYESIIDKIPKRKATILDYEELKKAGLLPKRIESQMEFEETGRRLMGGPKENILRTEKGQLTEEEMQSMPMWFKRRMLLREPTEEELLSGGLESTEEIQEPQEKAEYVEPPNYKGIPLNLVDKRIFDYVSTPEARAELIDKSLGANLKYYEKAKEAALDLNAIHKRGDLLKKIRSVPKEDRDEFLYSFHLARKAYDLTGPSTANRSLEALTQGFANIAASPVEFAGLGGSEDELRIIHTMKAIASPVEESDPWHKAAVIQGLGATPEMLFAATLGRIGGKFGGQIGKRYGKEKIGEWLGTTAGITAAIYPRAYYDAYFRMRDEGVGSTKAKLFASLSAAASSLSERIVPDPFRGKLPGFMSRVNNKILQRAAVIAKNYPGELTEELVDNLSSEILNSTATILDEEAPDMGYGGAFTRAIQNTAESAAPLAITMVAGGGATITAENLLKRIEQRGVIPTNIQETTERLGKLKNVVKKKFVSKEDGQELGLSGKNRKERMAEVKGEIQTLEKEIQDAQTVREDQAVPEETGEVGQRGEEYRGGDIREAGTEQVSAEPTSEVTEAQVEPAEAIQAEEPIQQPTEATVTPQESIPTTETPITPVTQQYAVQEPETAPAAQQVISMSDFEGMSPRELGEYTNSKWVGTKKSVLVDRAMAKQEVASKPESIPEQRKAIRGGIGGDIPTSQSGKIPKTPSTGEVVSSLSEAFNVPIRTGHFGGGEKRKGIYKDLEEVARIKGYGDISVAAHEVAHHVDKTASPLSGIPKQMNEELAALDYKPERGDIHEGFAEYVRHKLTTDEASSVAPSFDGWFDNWLIENPEIENSFNSARETVDQWRSAGSINRVKAQIHMGESRWKQIGRALKPKSTWDWVANNWINRLRPLLNVAKEMTGDRTTAALIDEMPVDVNFWAFAKTSNMRASSKARGWAKFGTTDAFGKKVGPGLKETFAPIANELQNKDELHNFYAYAYARHASTLYEQYESELAEWRKSGEIGPAPRLKNPGISKTDALETIREFDSKDGWNKAAEGLTSWHNDLIDYLADAGGLTKEAADIMKEMYPNYISLARHIDSEFAATVGGGGKRFANLPKGVRRLKGSGRQILPPLESALAYAERIIGLSDKIRVSNMLVDASEKYGTLGDTVEEVDPKDTAISARLETLKSQLEDAGADLSKADMDSMLTIFSQDFSGDAKDSILVLYRDGNPKLYYVRPDLYRSLMAVDNPAKLPKIIDQTFGRVARAIRLGTTGLKAGFSLLTNPMRDIQTAMMQTEYQPRNPFSIAINAAQGLVEDLTGSEVAQMWERGGGPMAQPLGVDRKFLKETVQDLLAQSPKAKVLNWATHPVDSLRSLFSFPEAAPRLAEFRAALVKLGWKPGQEVTAEQYIKAQLAAANVTVDFTEGGALAMWLNQITPFFNATIQGPHRMASAIRNHPVATISSAIMWMTIPTLLLWYKNKDEEWYKDLSPSEKARYWHIRIPGMSAPLRIPKPFEWGHIFSSIPEGAAQTVYDKDPEAIGESFKAALEDMTPSAIPGLIEVPVEIAANKDFYFDRRLVPERMKGLEPKDQYNPYTTETAKSIGKLLGVSPIYAEHLAGGWTGGLATDAIRTTESVFGKKKTQREITGGPSTLPVIGRLFLSELHTRQFDDFYTRLGKLEQKHASLKIRNQSDPSITMLKFMQKVSDDMSELRKESREVLADESITDDKKREKFFNIHFKMLQMAKEANQMSHIKRPSTTKEAEEKWNKIHKEESSNIVYNSSKPKPEKKNYKGRESDYDKAVQKYNATRELDKRKAEAVAKTHNDAQKLLLEHYRDKNGRIKPTASYYKRSNTLAEMYGKTPKEARAWRDAYRAKRNAK